MSQINSKISRIFISCASEQYSVAKKIYFSLRASNYDVFFAPENLLAGEEYNRKLREEIQSSDLMIFLISPQSVEEGSYARTELRFAEEIWKNPVSKVLPVMIVDTDVSLIPEYLQAVTIFKSRGNLAAEVLATVDKLVAHASPKFPNNIVVSAWFSTFLNELIDDVKRSSNILKARIFVLEHEQPWYSNPIPKSTIFNEEFKHG